MARCLIVDDSKVIRKVAKRIIASLEISPVEAENTAEALRFCNADMPEYLLVSNILADNDLETFLRQVRSIDGRIAPFIVVMMPELDLVRMMKAKRAGANDYILKPFDRDLMSERFELFIEQQSEAAA